MGILADETKEDIGLITDAVNFSQWIWDQHRSKHPEETRKFELNEEHIESLSKVADLIYDAYFPNVNFYERVGTFLILVNSSTLVRLYDDGKVVTSIPAWRNFVGRLSLVFANSALRCWGREGQEGCFIIKPITDEYAKYLLLSFLEKIDSIEVSIVSSAKSRRPDELHRALRTLARDILSAVSVLYPRIEFAPGDASKIHGAIDISRQLE